ncbi:NAD(P)/FAD-dependent oxidoreductase [Paraburkholderia sabiae]|uniref:Ferredoxin--NADP reductase n=1 Tax=Paraburkholderia sabiae TaxID=273251 RepID=A0ABU9QFM5_9BURK|nr:NAD(P)/FAD-dependent oxidoreductase [Paraburkholderia sabiae]WJZ76834.1 NAD(P)/FAD-dependent oxidoreductase [Paraburkholderia sabiae]CAD6546924.1 Ferredoxin--NADP reductase [Paraburkholderia sabiae]
MTTASNTQPASPISTDVLIIGAGPVGLFAAFEAGVIGLSSVIVDNIERVGGQCIELYPDKPIYDIPAIPSCTARELVDRLLEQCRPFEPPLHLGHRVETVERQDSGRWLARTDKGLTFDAASILIAAGNGSFVPQRLQLDDAAPLEGRHVHYSVRSLDDFAGKKVVVAGGGDSALDWTLALLSVAERVTLVHRRNGFSATDSSVANMRRAVEAGEMDFAVGTITNLNAPGGRLESIDIRQAEGSVQHAADHLLVLFGLVADLGPIANWGIEVQGGRITVDTSNYESSCPGIFAAGDIAGYPNKQKLILSGFHEASLALRKAYSYAFPEKKRVHIHSSYDAKLAERVAASHA